MITLEYIKQIVSSVLVDYEEEFINKFSQCIYECNKYNSESELLAIAKLSQPILKSKSREALIKVKLDF